MAQKADSTTTLPQPRKTYSVKSGEGREFSVRVVPNGGRYGLNDCRVNTGLPMVEFYWAETDLFTGERYSISTLLKDHHKGFGLRLQGVDASFSAQTMNDVLVWAVGGDPESPWG
tara:strand:+ start:1448 stop:1792 length:345 start_codon:yes stop_codon:yes gene_type:complete